MPVLQIRDKNGKFIPIPAVKGNDGKSAYEQAKEGGYTGTEEEFIAFLNGLISPAPAVVTVDDDALVEIQNKLNAHISNEDNPHKVEIADMGAFSVDGGTIQGDVKLHGEQYPMLKIGRNDSETSSFQYTPNKTVDIYNWVNGQPTTISLGNSGSMLLRDVLKLWVGAKDYQIYGDHNASELGIARVASGSYVGTGTGGADNPTVLSFPFQPKVVYISVTGQTNRCDATLPLVYGSRIGLVYSATSSNWSTHSTYPLNLVWEGNTLSMTYTLNNTSVEQRQLNSSGLTYEWFAWG